MGHDLKVIEEALRKRREGRKVSHVEGRALKAWEAEIEERDRAKHYATIPRRYWLASSGVYPAKLTKLAADFRAPFGGDVIELALVIRWIHDLLRDKGDRILEENLEPELAGPMSPALEKLREEKYQIARLDRMRMEKSLMPRDQVHGVYLQVADALRAVTDKLARKGAEKIAGAEAAEMFTEALDRVSQMVERQFSSGEGRVVRGE